MNAQPVWVGHSCPTPLRLLLRFDCLNWKKNNIQVKGVGQECPTHTGADLCPHITLCDNVHMATNLALDDRLIEEARRVGRHRTKREAVSAALAEYVKRRKQLGILEVFGTVDFDPKYDYKAERNRKRS